MTTKIGVMHVVTQKVTLEDHEIERHSRAVVVLIERRDKAEEERKRVNKEGKKRVDGMTAEINRLVEAVNTGAEERELTVVWRRMTDGDGAELVEASTGRVVDRRALEPWERQLDIRDVVKEEPTETVDLAPTPEEDAADDREANK